MSEEQSAVSGSAAPEDQDPGTGDVSAVVCPDIVVPSSPSVAPPSEKIEVLLKPVGDAPILRQKRYLVDGDKSVLYIIGFIRKCLGKGGAGGDDEGVFVYVNQCFSPSPDQTIGDLHRCFASDGKLVLHYSKTHAWG